MLGAVAKTLARTPRRSGKTTGKGTPTRGDSPFAPTVTGGSEAAQDPDSQTEKLSPQEQEALAFGLLNLKPPAINAEE
jgi:hypothetical protein